MPKYPLVPTGAELDAEDLVVWRAQSVARDRQCNPTRPPVVTTDDGNNPYHPIYDDRPVVMFDSLRVQLRSDATPQEIGKYARGMVDALPPCAANIEKLLAVSNEISLHPRPLQPRAALADAIRSENVEAWARVLLLALISPGFAKLSAWDREALVRLHAALVARLLGAQLDTRCQSATERQQ